jgi:hypothetical protein
MPGRKKLIEVALPLEAINKASAREKSIRHGHPSTLHLSWARRPFQRELAFGGTSVNYDFRERLVQAEEPR